MSISEVIENYKIPKYTEIKNSDQLFNVCCFLYLQQIFLNLDESIIVNNKNLFDKYYPNVSYGNYYAQFLSNLEEDKSKIENKYCLLYINKNLALEYITEVIKANHWLTNNTIDKAEQTLQSNLSKSFFDPQVNDLTPENAGSNLGRLSNTLASSFGGDFKPMLQTSIPQVRTYAYQSKFALPMELRFGTQAQFHNGEARISPLFEKFIIEQKVNEEQDKITHVYFNLLKCAKGGELSYERNKEAALSEQLHQLDNKHSNLAVITLPADDDILKVDYITYENAGSLQSLKNKLISKLTDPDKKGDFYISEKVKGALFDNADNIEDQWKNKVDELWNNSLNHFHFEDRENLTKTEFQAVYFHFFKYELPNFILNKLQPSTFNMSCKDAIDRGGVASLYYNVNKAESLGEKLTNSEFINKGLHAAAVEVKGRGLNHHEKLLCNAIYHARKSDDQKYLSNPSESGADVTIANWCDKNRSVDLKKEEIIHGIKKAIESNSRHEDLESLKKSIEGGKTNSDSNYHELWHQKSGLSYSYQGQYGNTATGEYILDYIENKIQAKSELPEKNCIVPNMIFAAAELDLLQNLMELQTFLRV
ncbi:hypothetical protein L3V82_01470 [Thiotrichales bacterium 19S3-7]|nr:hypothetical protein [Thiotrichales bacterium 19S3-7]MCF6800832.1 hypothetical protein [Thiotrichales bacterium 19S3-11]